MRNRFGVKLDSNGYAPSIVQENTEVCYICKRCDHKLDRHEPFHGPYRDKSKALGLWVALCHESCHLGKAHNEFQIIKDLKQDTQEAAMERYGWDTETFIREFGKNWL